MGQGLLELFELGDAKPPALPRFAIPMEGLSLGFPLASVCVPTDTGASPCGPVWHAMPLILGDVSNTNLSMALVSLCCNSITSIN